jgi:hypothetical protein
MFTWPDALLRCWERAWYTWPAVALPSSDMRDLRSFSRDLRGVLGLEEVPGRLPSSEGRSAGGIHEVYTPHAGPQNCRCHGPHDASSRRVALRPTYQTPLRAAATQG